MMRHNLMRILGVLGLMAAVVLLASQLFKKEPSPMTIEEAKRLKFRVSVGGVGFDVPVNYHHHDYKLLKEWPRPPDTQVAGRERTPVDYIRIYAVLPDMAGYAEENAVEFDTPGWGRTVNVSMTDRQRIIWKYYFDNFVPSLKPVPMSPQVPGMFHYVDSSGHDIYLSHDYPSTDIVRIVCLDLSKAPSPSCEVDTHYGDKRFQLSFSFGLPFLPQWREIDSKVKALLDQFAASAKQHP